MATTNISNDYTLLNQSTSIEERKVLGPGVAASVTITYTGAGADGHKITIIDALKNSKTYELDNSDPSSVTAGNIRIDITDNTSDNTFERLKNAIEAPSGHDGEIICVHDKAANTLKLTQKKGGIAGNTDITIVGTGWIANDPSTLTFENGQDVPIVPTEGQFLLSTRSTVNIRGQSTGSIYRVFRGEEKS